MRILANVFLVLFAADGATSLLDDLLPLVLKLAPLSAARQGLANAVVLLALAVYLCLGIDRRLPKRVLLPLTLFALLFPFAPWISLPLAHLPHFGLLGSILQVCLLTLPLHFFRYRSGKRTLLLSHWESEAPCFSAKNTLVFFAAQAVVIPVLLILIAFHGVNAYLADNTAGFMRVEPRGLYMIERVYRRDHRTIRLASMIHIGEKGYYDDLVGSISPGRTVVLAEGVSDQGNLLKNRFSYGRIASLLGLVSQEKMQLNGREIEEENLGEGEPPDGERGDATGPADILRADVDVSSFHQPTLLLLDQLGKCLGGSRSLGKGVLALNAWARKNITPQMNEVIMDDILRRRNQELLRQLDPALKRYDTVIIPWGAMHMKEIEQQVLKRGFTLQEERKRRSVDFARVVFMGGGGVGPR